jgi:hypothetical protein
MAAKKRKEIDPNRVVVKRERSEIYAVVSALELAKAKRAKVAKRLGELEILKAGLADYDKEIARLGQRLNELTTGPKVSESEEHRV